MAHRTWLEVLKYLEPKELLYMELVNHELRELSRCDEVWGEHLTEEPTESMSCKSACREQLCVSHHLAIFQNFTLTLTLIDLSTLTGKSVSLDCPDLPTSFSAWVCIPKKVIYCGGVGNRGTYLACSFEIDIASFRVTQLPDMHTNRAGGGMVFYKGITYIFGGDNDRRGPSGYGDLRECEKYTKKTGWIRLPNMTSPRRFFTPCAYQGHIYIAGGGGATNTVEIFDVRSETYLHSHITVPFTDKLASCFVLGTELGVLCGWELTRYNVKTGKQMGKKALPSNEYWYSPNGSMKYKDRIYFGVYNSLEVYSVGLDWEVAQEQYIVK